MLSAVYWQRVAYSHLLQIVAMDPCHWTKYGALPVMKELLHKISVATEKLERFLIMTAIIAMMTNSTANAIGRYAFNKSLFFSEELNQFLIVSVTFIGFAYAVRQGRNIRMTAVYDSLSTKAQKVLTTIIALLTAMLMFYLTYHAFF